MTTIARVCQTCGEFLGWVEADNLPPGTVTLRIAPGVTWQLSPATNATALQAELDAIAAEPEGLGWPMTDAECAALLPPLCGNRAWLEEYRNARNAGADDGFAAAAADVVAYGVRYAVGLKWDEEPIEGDWRD